MSKIVISGYYGFANAGDEAMLTAIIKSLRAAERSVSLIVISGSPEATAARHQVASIHRFNPFEIIPAIMGCSLLLSGGGSLLQDVTSKRSLLYYLTILLLGKLFGKRVMLFAQGIGPINSCILRKLTSIICSSADLITVRDADSLAELRKMGVPQDKVRLTADAVLTLLPGDRAVGRDLLDKFNVPQDQKLIAISVRDWEQGGDFLRRLATAAGELAVKENAHIVLLPLQYPADAKACKKLQSYLPACASSTVLDAAYDTDQFLALMGNFALLIGMRLHALIFAAVMELPFVALSYDPKIDGFVKEVAGVSAGKIDEFKAADVVGAADKALRLAGSSNGRLRELRQKAQLNSQMAFNLLHH